MTYRPVGDPVTDRIDPVPAVCEEWGTYGVCEPVRAAVGDHRYDAFFPETFAGVLAAPDDLHDAAIVEITSLLAPHVDHDDLGYLARRWVEAVTLLRNAALPRVTLGLKIEMDDPDDGHSRDRILVMVAEADEVVLSMFCSCGELAMDPVCYWREDERMCMGAIEDADVPAAMRDMGLQRRRWESTRMAVDAARRQAERPQGVIDMAAFAAIRAARL